MNGKTRISRRSFLGKAAAASALALPAIIPSGVLAQSPNGRVGIGVIGPGRRGSQLMGELPRSARIVALADVNKPRLERLADGKDWRIYTDYRKLLESNDIDGVLVATPDHWHALCSIHACMAEKDVYCEKPLTLTVKEGRAMVNAARKYNRVFQTGSQQRSDRNSRKGCELVRNRHIGKIELVHGHNYPSPWTREFPEQPVPEGLDWDMWLGQTPPRPYHKDIYTPRANPGWISLKPYSGGEMTGWGSHGLDMIQWALGMDESGPVEVWPVGEGLECEVRYRYANGIEVRLDGKGPMGGALFIGERGQIVADRGKYSIQPEELEDAKHAEREEKLYVSNFHMGNWLECVKTRERPIADVEAGHRSCTVCHLGNIARWTGRKLKWDPVAETFEGDGEANSMLERPMREPWGLPVI